MINVHYNGANITTYLPSMKRKPYTQQQCPFERDFIRKVVKDMEPTCTIRRIQSGKQDSVFYQHISTVEKNLKSDWNWSLQHCYDMVSEVFHYLTEVESDNNKTASVTTSRINKLIVWPEIVTTLIMIKYNIDHKQATDHFLQQTLP